MGSYAHARGDFVEIPSCGRDGDGDGCDVVMEVVMEVEDPRLNIVNSRKDERPRR
jgi:hypothetical protein